MTRNLELDGLRAIAILGVLLFHAGFTTFQGGFVGVDVFFVISGYIITKKINAEISNTGFVFSSFYRNRIARLAPALLVVVFVTALLYIAILPPPLTAKLQAAVAPSLLSFANFYFYWTTDYFSDNSNSPLLHTWSLAVEEQFYLVFPVLLWSFRNFGEKLKRRAVFGLACASFIAQIIFIAENKQGAFYLPWFRAWELLLGAWLAMLGRKTVAINPRRILLMVAAGSIVAFYLLFGKHLTFPGFWALPPVLATMAAIFAIEDGALAVPLLRSRFIQFVGKASYSIYLVHWPVCCLFAVFFVVTTKVAVLAVLVSLVLGGLSWRFIELPAQRALARGKFVTTFGVLLVAIAAVLSVASFGRAEMKEIWAESPELSQYAIVAERGRENFTRQECFLTAKGDALSKHCMEVSDKGKRTYVLIGDSHAANLYWSLSQQFADANVLQATATTCRPSLAIKGDATYCKRMYADVFQALSKKPFPAHTTFILAAQWRAGDLNDAREVTNFLLSQGYRVVLVGPRHEYQISLPIVLGIKELYGVDLRKQVLKRDRFVVEAELKKVLDSRVRYFSSIQVHCFELTCRSQLEAGSPVYFDGDHYTRDAADWFVRKLIKDALSVGYVKDPSPLALA